jgi:nicotinamidase-related amidase
MTAAPRTCLICVDLQADALSGHLMALRSRVRAQAAILKAARDAGTPVIHLRNGERGVDFARLAPRAGEGVFVRPAGSAPFDDMDFRRHLNALDPSHIEIMAAYRSAGDARLAMSLSNVGFRVHLLAETLQQLTLGVDVHHIASVQIHHPGLKIARGPREAIPASQKRIANES